MSRLVLLVVFSNLFAMVPALAKNAKETPESPALTYVVLGPASSADIHAHGHCKTIINRLKKTPVMIPVADAKIWLEFKDRNEIGVNSCAFKYNIIFYGEQEESLQ
ncbi:MAG: hypothetical protein NW215_00435 [Hyphomicrobiales bacterium]|nr:hypothetical protein [Hyphomicrobiales bacterium]